MELHLLSGDGRALVRAVQVHAHLHSAQRAQHLLTRLLGIAAQAGAQGTEALSYAACMYLH